MTVIGSLGILFAWTTASGLSAARADTAALALQKPLEVERNAMSGWQIGYAEADIRPASGEAMLAGFGQPRQVAGTLAPLRAQALAFEDGRGRRALLFTADVLGFGRVSVDVLRRKLEKAHGIPASAVCFGASHTHWGPAINYGANFAIGGLNVWYVGRLEETMLNLADKALRNLSPGRVEYGACEVHIGMSRRLPNERGEIGWGPNPNGSYDPPRLSCESRARSRQSSSCWLDTPVIRPARGPSISGRSSRGEAMRSVIKGEHSSAVECQGEIRVEKFVVNSIPELIPC